LSQAARQGRSPEFPDLTIDLALRPQDAEAIQTLRTQGQASAASGRSLVSRRDALRAGDVAGRRQSLIAAALRNRLQRLPGAKPPSGAARSERRVEHITTEHLRAAEANLTSSGVAIIGHHPGYTQAAKDAGASFFDIGPLWDQLSVPQRKAANDHFLDIVAQRRDTVVIWTPPSQRRSSSALQDETNRLINEKNYRLRPGSDFVLDPP
jgi:hypothetical protein